LDPSHLEHPQIFEDVDADGERQTGHFATPAPPNSLTENGLRWEYGQGVTPALEGKMKLFRDRKPLGLFKDLVTVAASDTEISAQEAHVLTAMGEKLGLAQRDVDQVLAKHREIKFIPPKSDREKFAHLLMCVTVMMADGKIDRREKDLCIGIAEKMGLAPSLVERMVEEFVEHVEATAKTPESQPEAAQTAGELEAEIGRFLRSRG
jgi:uncharacterized tellurite resistance protein B-like protein